MAQFPDFSPYCYFEHYYRNKTVNIGWIDVTQPYPQAAPPSGFLDRLFEYAKVSVSLARGAHFCEVCGPDRQFQGFGPARERLFLGMGEVRVFAADGATFAAPNLIYHYVADHSYAPPDMFIEAVMTRPGPPDLLYFEELDRSGLEWWKTRPVKD